jgi:hypothetical protein
VATAVAERESVTNRAGPESPAQAGPVFALWVMLIVALNGAAWITGVRTYTLETAVDEGAAQVERRGIGEVGDEVIRKAIRTQHATLPFWTTLAVMGDFVVEPLSLILRAVMVATLFAVVAALTGRSIGFGSALTASAWTQGFWVLGLAVRTGLMIALRRADSETSLALLLPPGPCPAAFLIASRQVDAFALLGWFSLACGGWRRGQTNLATALVVCGILWILESILRITFAMTIGAGMHLTVLPEH